MKTLIGLDSTEQQHSEILSHFQRIRLLRVSSVISAIPRFRIIQPLNENYSYDAEIENVRSNQKTTQKTTQKILTAMKDNPNITISELSKICEITVDDVKWQLKSLTKSGHISRIGGDRGGHWEVQE